MGSNSSQQSSRPLTAGERLDAYQTGVNAINATDRSNLGGDYVAPEFERLGEGDYARLGAGLNAGTERQQNLALRDSDQDAADRGIYTSLNALRLNNDVRERYAPQFAANDATLMQMKAGDVTAANAAAMENAGRKYDASWRPADYLAGIYNNTGGAVSSGKTSGWSI